MPVSCLCARRHGPASLPASATELGVKSNMTVEALVPVARGRGIDAPGEEPYGAPKAHLFDSLGQRPGNSAPRPLGTLKGRKLMTRSRWVGVTTTNAAHSGRGAQGRSRGPGRCPRAGAARPVWVGAGRSHGAIGSSRPPSEVSGVRSRQRGPALSRLPANSRPQNRCRRLLPEGPEAFALARIECLADRCSWRMDNRTQMDAFETLIVGSGHRAWRTFDELNLTIGFRPDEPAGPAGSPPTGAMAAPRADEAGPRLPGGGRDRVPKSRAALVED